MPPDEPPAPRDVAPLPDGAPPARVVVARRVAAGLAATAEGPPAAKPK